MKKLFLSTLVIFTLSLSADELLCDESALLDPVATMDEELMQKGLEESRAVLEASANLLTLSLAMLETGSEANAAYVSAMLRLSDDIGTMADRIGEMADRIVATELQIGLMADRILETQRIQSENLALTQANLLKAQENFNALLLQLAQ